MLASVLLWSAEVAFSSLPNAKVQKIKAKKSRFSGIILKYYSNHRRLHAIALLSTCIVSLCLTLVSFWFFNKVSSLLFNDVPQNWISIVATLVVMLLCSYVVPSIISKNKPYTVVAITTIPLFLFDIVFLPVNLALEHISKSTSRKYNYNDITLHDITQAIDLTNNDMSHEKGLLEGIVKLKTTDVKKIMKSRVDVVAIDISMPFDALKSSIIENVYSRMPVYDGTFDNIKGILFVKDLIPHMAKSSFKWQSLVRPAYYIPQSKRIDDLLEEFQKRKVHMAFVIDEYGGTLGIVTLEDILEEIVGEINDEFDDEPQDYVILPDNTYLCEGKLLLNDFLKLTNLTESFFEDKQGEAETLAGLILELKGDFPAPNEEIMFKNLIFKIESEDQRRIKKIRVKISS